MLSVKESLKSFISFSIMVFSCSDVANINFENINAPGTICQGRVQKKLAGSSKSYELQGRTTVDALKVFRAHVIAGGDRLVTLSRLTRVKSIHSFSCFTAGCDMTGMK
jgi:hypothetical protein